MPIVSVGPSTLIVMAFDDLVSRWTSRINTTAVVINGLSQTLEASGPVPLGRTFIGGLRESILGDVVASASSDAPASGSALEAIVMPVVDAAKALLDAPYARNSKDIVPLIVHLAEVSTSAEQQLERLNSDSTTVQEVVEEFERDFQISLLATLTGHTGVLAKVAEWERSRSKADGSSADYLQISSMTLVKGPGPGRLSMHVLDSATDSGINFMTPTFRATIDRSPALQRNLFGQWFTYIYSTWEDVYRQRLAKAHGLDEDGIAWTKNDVTSDFFGDIKQIRHDFAHNAGICSNSASNKMLNWAAEGTPIHGKVEQMIGLVDLFPREELMRVPSRSDVKLTPLPWGLPDELVVRVRAHLDTFPRKRRSEILGDAIEQWLSTK